MSLNFERIETYQRLIRIADEFYNITSKFPSLDMMRPARQCLFANWASLSTPVALAGWLLGAL